MPSCEAGCETERTSLGDHRHGLSRTEGGDYRGSSVDPPATPFGQHARADPRRPTPSRPTQPRSLPPPTRAARVGSTMLIPIGTDRPLRRPALITPVLIGINLAVFIGQMLLERTDPERYEHLLRPLLISGPDFRPWQPLTYAFLHADWLHVLG